MPSAPVAAVPASLPEQSCINCGKPARQVCGACGEPQPLAAGESYFDALDAPVRFKQDLKALERAFYAASRALHPDRFTTAAPASRARSLERMSFLNEAYAVLKDPRKLREYFMERAGLKLRKEGRPPAELAEAWFEVQDAISDAPETAAAKLAEFGARLGAESTEVERRLVALEARLDGELATDGEISRAGVEELAALLNQQAYLASMARDVMKRDMGRRQ